MAQSSWPYGVLQIPDLNMNWSIGNIRGTMMPPCSCLQDPTTTDLCSMPIWKTMTMDNSWKADNSHSKQTRCTQEGPTSPWSADCSGPFCLLYKGMVV